MNPENFFNKRLDLKKQFKEEKGVSYNQYNQEASPDTDDDIDALLGSDSHLKDIIDQMYTPESEATLSFGELRKEIEQARSEDEKLQTISDALRTLNTQEELLLKKRYELTQYNSGTAIDDQLSKKLDRAEEKIDAKKEALEYGNETWKYARMAELSEYKEQLDRGFVQTPSRKEAITHMSELLTGGGNIFLEGDSGTGKTQILKNMVRLLDGYTPEVFPSTDQSRDSDIYGKTGLASKDGATETLFVPGMLVRSLTEGKKIIFDEFNNMEQATRLGLKKFYDLRPGDTFTVPQDGSQEFVVREGFGFLATGNLPSPKHPDRKPLGNEEIREFKMPHLDHLPKEEVYDLLLTAAMREDMSAPLSKKEAETTLKHLTEAIEEVHNAYEGVGSFYSDVMKKEKAILKKAVLDPKEYISWIQGYKHQTNQSLQAYLADNISFFINKGSFPESDRNLMFKIFATKGLMDGVSPALCNIEMSEAQSLGWQSESSSELPAQRNLSLDELATLDPFDMRQQRMDTVVEDFINNNAEALPTQETITDIEEALEIMGESQFIGPDDIEKTFGFQPDTIPEIQFSPEELERAKELGQKLILYVDMKEDGTAFTMKDMEKTLNNKTSDDNTLIYNTTQSDNWFNTETSLHEITPRAGWRLTTLEVIENSTNKNYLGQTEELITYLEHEVFAGEDMPQEYIDAIEEFRILNTPDFREKVKSSTESEWKQAAQKLSALSINQMTRENFSEIIYRLACEEKKSGTKELSSKYSWSNSLASGGTLVSVGFFVSNGLSVFKWNPVNSIGGIGVCFSRSV